MENEAKAVTPVDLAQWRAVLATMTTGPWHVAIEWDPDMEFRAITIPEIHRSLHDGDWADLKDWKRDQKNAEGVVFLVNGAPALLDEVERLRATVKELSELANDLESATEADFATRPHLAGAIAGAMRGCGIGIRCAIERSALAAPRGKETDRGCLQCAWPRDAHAGERVCMITVHNYGTVDVVKLYRDQGYQVLPPQLTINPMTMKQLVGAPADYHVGPWVGTGIFGDAEAVPVEDGDRFIVFPQARDSQP